MLADEIMGEENYRNTFVVARVKKNIQENEMVRGVNFGYDSVLFYAKSDQCLINPPKKYQAKVDRWHAFDAPGIRPSMEYIVFGKKPPKGRHWMYSEDRATELIRKGELRPNPSSGSIQYLLKASDYTLLDTNWTDIQEYSSDWGFPNGEKNVELVKRTIKMLDKPNAIILDSFAGSGTTAHAVLDLNKDGGNRKFILVECEDYADNLTAERIRRVIRGFPDAKDEKLKNGLGGSFSFFELGEPIEIESILEGNKLPSYLDLARYVFYTATGEEFLPEQVDEARHFIGESKDYQVYLFYKPDITYLKSTSLTLEIAEGLGTYTGKKKLVFAPTKYLDLNDSELLAKHGLKGIEYCQLPFEIYRLKE
jgi:adenine-specific DNA-methyltransferase